MGQAQSKLIGNSGGSGSGSGSGPSSRPVLLHYFTFGRDVKRRNSNAIKYAIKSQVFQK